MKRRIILAASFAVFFATMAIAAERVAVICYGEHRAECEPNTTLHIGCAASVDATAKSFCTIQTKDGPQVVPYFLDHKSTKAGNRCGYNMYMVTCQTDRP